MHHLVDRQQKYVGVPKCSYMQITLNVSYFFFPRFNIIDEPPYATGEPCSECPEQYHECEQHLCSKL